MYTFPDEAVSFNFFIKKGNIPFVFYINKISSEICVHNCISVMYTFSDEVITALY